jgi:restriction system protein
MVVKINKTHAEFINWMPPFLKALKEKGGSATVKEVRSSIAKQMELSDSVLTFRYEKSGQLKFDNQVYWAKQYLVWENLVTVSSHGIWALTAEGWKVSLTYEKALALFNKWVKIFQNTKKNANIKKNIAPLEDGHKTESDVLAEEEPETNISLIELLRKTTPKGFERLCGRLLLEYNFENITITKHSHDGGIDGYAILKLNPFVNMSVYFQCKKYEGTVPISHIREFIGVLAQEKQGVDKGIFITTGSFTATAFDLERNNTRLELIDGEKLVEMFEKAELGVKPRTVYDPELKFFIGYMTDDDENI